MNIDAEVLKKYLQTKSSSILEGLYTMTKRGLSQECKGGSMYENQPIIICHINRMKVKQRDHLN